MGSGGSRGPCCRGGSKEEERGPLVPALWPTLKLEASGLRFGRAQLARLNLQLAGLLHADQGLGGADVTTERCRGAAEQAVERLVQRLLCAVGRLDPRFASKFLVTLAPRNERAAEVRWPGRRFRYLVRLDALSSPPLYAPCKEDEESADHGEDEPENYENPPSRAVDGDEAGALPAGWVRVRPCPGQISETWGEFISPSGCLRRDRVVERFAVLLSQAAAASPSEDEVDEAHLCGSPGKIMDAGILQEVLRLPPNRQLFYGPGEAHRVRPPDPRDFQLAVVHGGGAGGGSGAVMLRVGFLSPALQATLEEGAPSVVEVRLHLAVGLEGWPTTADFPARLPLHHPHALLCYRAAQTGYYAVATGPPGTLRCEERRSAWQAWFPAAEMELDTHYGASSTPGRALAALRAVVDQLRAEGDAGEEGQQEAGLRMVHLYTLRSLMWKELERWPSAPAWEPAALAAHVLLMLDALLAALRSRHADHFLMPGCNLLLDQDFLADFSSDDQEDVWEAALAADALVVSECLTRLHSASLQREEMGVLGSGNILHEEWVAEEQRRAALEVALLSRWRSALQTLVPMPPTPPRPLLGCLWGREKQPQAPRPEQFSLRQLDYIACVVRELLLFRRAMLTQGGGGEVGDLFMEETIDPTEDFLFLLRSVVEQALGNQLGVGRRSKCHRRHRRDTERREVWLQSVAEAVRREVQPRCSEGDDSALVRLLLTWLHRAASWAPGTLAQRLAHFVARLWESSRESAWHLLEWRRRHEECSAELAALGAFCSMLLASQEGWTGVAVLRDAADKGWRWARAAQAELARSGSLQLVLAPAPGVVRRCDVSLALAPEDSLGRGARRSKTLPGTRRGANITQEELTMRMTRVLPPVAATMAGPSHLRLRDGSPLSATLDARRRYGQQPGLGDLVPAFIAMQKFSVLQEVAALLPDTERLPVLDALQRLSRSRRHTRGRRTDEESNGRYISRHTEFPSLAPPEPPLDDQQAGVSRASSEAAPPDTILGSCRTARTLQRRHSVLGAFPGDTGVLGALPLLQSASPASVRRRYGGGPARHALLQLTEARELTLSSPQQPRPLSRRITRL